MSRFVTVLRREPEFLPLILGSFSRTERAIPVETFSARSERERVTFQILELEKLERPFWGRIVWIAMRPQFLTLGLGPLLAVLVYLMVNHQSIQWWDLLATSLSLLFLHSAVFFLNDYFGHVSGVDRANPKRGSRVLQNGWLPAYQLKQLGVVCLILAGLIGLPVLIVRPLALSLIGFVAGIAILTHTFWPRRGIKELLTVLCLGPLLMWGFAAAISGTSSWMLLHLGLLFGVTASLTFQMKDFEHLFGRGAQSATNLMMSLGFDRSRQVLRWELAAVLALTLLLPIWPSFQSPWLFSFLGLIYFARRAELRLIAATSPLSSSLIDLWREGAYLHTALSLATLVIFLGHWQ